MESIIQEFNIRIAGRDYHYGRDSPFRFSSGGGKNKLKGKEVKMGIGEACL